MSVATFMKKEEIGIKQIIEEMPQIFSSHDFIKKFSKKYEGEYINNLANTQAPGAFRSVHSQIAIYLSNEMSYLGIKKEERKESQNIFGDMDIIQWWKKTD